jgi:hypothetical protein
MFVTVLWAQLITNIGTVLYMRFEQTAC